LSQTKVRFEKKVRQGGEKSDLRKKSEGEKKVGFKKNVRRGESQILGKSQTARMKVRFKGKVRRGEKRGEKSQI
jgi:hypothetical protein